MAGNTHQYQMKRTSVSGRTPNTTDPANTSYIPAGGLAVNFTDKIVYTSNGSSLIEVGSTPSSINTASATITNLTVSNTITLGITSINSTSYSGTANNTIYWDGVTLATLQGQIAANAATAYSNAISVSASYAANAFANAVNYISNGVVNGAIVAANAHYSSNSSALGGVSLATLQNQFSGNAVTAYTNAVSYANSKASEAYTNAASYTDTKAGQAYANAVANAASLYQTTADLAANVLVLPANSASYLGNSSGTLANITSWISGNNTTAYSNAVADAGTDASNKAATAYSNATSYADTKAGQAYSNAVANAAAIYQTTAGLSANVATLTANAAGYLGNSSGTLSNIESWITGNSATAYSNATSYTDTKSGTAYSNAVSTAASDASSKAATAYSNATSYADIKAGTAYSNAVADAAIDASSKAATAYSNATSYADTKAATAYSNATSYTDTKAGTAYSNAMADAATDASTKAATAYSNATSYADTKAGTAYSNATVFASNASNINTGTLAEARLPYRMDQNVATNSVVTFTSLFLSGNLTVGSNVNIIGANNYSVTDNMIYLNANATYTNPDIGITAAYNDGSYHHAGFFRDHTNGIWKVFDGYDPEPDANIYIDQTNSSFQIANFMANTIYIGNNTVYGTVNSSIYSGTANNANNLGGSSLATIQGQITGNAATAYSNATSYTDTKAGQAYSNAIADAATDASSKAATAYSNATSYADTKAGTAYSNATSYADTKAGTAYSNAVADAAIDASSKAATAYSNATSYADTKAGTAYSNATAFASNADNISSGTVGPARLGSGTANSTTVLYGNGVWAAVSGGAGVNTDATYTWSNIQTFNSNVVFGAGISANGSYGSPGQVLTTNGTGVSWQTVSTGGGLLAGDGLGSNATYYYVIGNSGIVSNSSGVFVNTAYIATLTANAAGYLGNSSGTLSNIESWITGNAATAYTNSTSYADTKAGQAYSNAVANAAAIYQTTAGLSANVATLTSNNTLYLNGSSLTDIQNQITGNSSTAYTNAINYAGNGVSNGAWVAANATYSSNSGALESVSLATLQSQITGNAATAYSNAVANAAAIYQTSAGLSANVVLLTANAATYLGNSSGTIANVSSWVTGNAATAYSNATAYSSNADNLSSGTVNPARLGSGTANSTTVLYGNGVWGAVGGGSFSNGIAYTWSDVQTFAANVVIQAGISANGSYGSSGQVLTSNGTVAYWSTPSTSGGSSWAIKTGNYTAVKGDLLYCDTTSAAFTITLPATPSSTDAVTISSGPSASGNNLTIGRNSSTIMDLSEDMIVSDNNITFTLIYNGTTWRIA